MEGQELDLSEIQKDIAWIARFLSEGKHQRHWGVWHPKRGWEVTPGRILWHTVSRALAEAQRDVTVREWKDGDLYEVRCIEEWADERQT